MLARQAAFAILSLLRILPITALDNLCFIHNIFLLRVPKDTHTNIRSARLFFLVQRSLVDLLCLDPRPRLVRWVGLAPAIELQQLGNRLRLRRLELPQKRLWI